MKWKDIFEDPDMVGQSEYLAIHEAIATAVMGTDSPDPEQKISRGKQLQIAEMLEEIGGQTRRLSEALSKRLPIKTYWRACECGRVLIVTERDDRRASGGKSLEFDWKKGSFTASRCLASFPCPDCGRMIGWNDGSWQVTQGSRNNEPHIWLQEDESEGTAKCGLSFGRRLAGERRRGVSLSDARGGAGCGEETDAGFAGKGDRAPQADYAESALRREQVRGIE